MSAKSVTAEGAEDAEKMSGDGPARAGWGRAAVLVGIVLAASWYGMMLVHELGHALHAAVSGGEVGRIVWTTLAFSRTEIGHNPEPAFVVWGGFVWGVLIPLVVLGVGRLAGLPHLFLLRFFAGFCLVANGVYLSAGVVVPAGDTEDLLRLGTPAWVLAAAGVPMAAAGVWMWNGLGRRFGIGGEPPARGAVAAAGCAAAALAVMMAAVNLV